MRAAIYHNPGDIRIEHVPDPKIQKPTDAIIRITHTAICGSDLWFYRGQQPYQAGFRTGHEPMGVVEEVGVRQPRGLARRHSLIEGEPSDDAGVNGFGTVAAM